MHEIVTWADPPAVILHHAGLWYGIRRDLAWEPYPTYPLDFGPGAIRAV